MTLDELLEIETRLTTATPGPWQTREGDPSTVETTAPAAAENQREICDTGFRDSPGGAQECRANARFIAHAPTDIPRLIAEVRRLSAEVHRLTPGPKVARWEPMRNPDNGFALRGGKARASQKPRTLGTYTLNGSLVYAFVGGKGESFFYEEHARAHIEAWAKSKGWTVQHDA